MQVYTLITNKSYHLIVFKKNGVLGYKDIEGYETRNISTFKCIKEADKIYNFSDFEITIHTGDGDRCKNHEYSYSKNSMDNLFKKGDCTLNVRISRKVYGLKTSSYFLFKKLNSKTF